MIRDWLPPALLGSADRVRTALGRSRFRRAHSWIDAVGRTRGYGALATPPSGTPWRPEGTARSTTDIQVIAALGICLDRIESSDVRVLDFGGGYGHSFGIAQEAYPTRDWCWTVCDLPKVVRYGTDAAPSAGLRWRTQERVDGFYDIGLASSSLQFVENPVRTLQWLTARCRFLIINRTPLWPIRVDAVTCQMLGSTPAYAAWFLSRDIFMAQIENWGEVICRWENVEDQAYFAGYRGRYSGMVVGRRD